MSLWLDCDTCFESVTELTTVFDKVVLFYVVVDVLIFIEIRYYLVFINPVFIMSVTFLGLERLLINPIFDNW